MHKVIITESSLRELLREMMDSPISVNPVVDPQAAEVDPTNLDFVPTNKVELMSALRTLISTVEDDNASQAYVTFKNELKKEKNEMRKDVTAETIIRNAIRKILKETFLIEAEPVRPIPKILIPKTLSLPPSSISDDDIKNALIAAGEDAVKNHLSKLSISQEKIDDDLKKKLNSLRAAAGTDAVVKLLKKSGFRGADAQEEAKKRIEKVLNVMPGDVEIKKIPFGVGSQKIDITTFKKNSEDLREKLNSFNFLNDEEKSQVAFHAVASPESFEAITNEDVIRFFSAYNSTIDVYNDLHKDGDISAEELKFIKTPNKLINSKPFQEAFGENFNNFALKKGVEVLKSIQNKGYFKEANTSLRLISKEMKLSISGVKKLSNIALGKFAIAGKAVLDFSSFSQYLDTPSEELQHSSWNPETGT